VSRRAVFFTVYGTPQSAGSKRSFAIRRGAKKIGGKMVGGTFTGKVSTSDDNPKASSWKDRVAQAAGEVMVEAGGGLFDGPLKLSLVFIVARPKGHFGKRGLRPSAPPHPNKRPDALKLARGTEDALTGVVYRDDAQNVLITLQKAWGEPERCEVWVGELT